MRLFRGQLGTGGAGGHWLEREVDAWSPVCPSTRTQRQAKEMMSPAGTLGQCKEKCFATEEPERLAEPWPSVFLKHPAGACSV